MDISFYREDARNSLSGKWGKAILITLIAAFFGATISGSGISLNNILDEDTIKLLPDSIQKIISFYWIIAGSVGIVFGLVQFFMGGVVQLGYCKAILKLVDGRDISVGDLFSEMHRFWDGFLLLLLRSLFTTLWTLLFIIPGIIAAYRYSMAPFLMAENPFIKPMDAIRASKEIMCGNKWSLFLLDLSFIGWHILCILSMGIGYLWLNPYINTAKAAFYRSLSPAITYE